MAMKRFELIVVVVTVMVHYSVYLCASENPRVVVQCHVEDCPDFFRDSGGTTNWRQGPAHHSNSGDQALYLRERRHGAGTGSSGVLTGRLASQYMLVVSMATHGLCVQLDCKVKAVGTHGNISVMMRTGGHFYYPEGGPQLGVWCNSTAWERHRISLSTSQILSSQHVSPRFQVVIEGRISHNSGTVLGIDDIIVYQGLCTAPEMSTTLGSPSSSSVPRIPPSSLSPSSQSSPPTIQPQLSTTTSVSTPTLQQAILSSTARTQSTSISKSSSVFTTPAAKTTTISFLTSTPPSTSSETLSTSRIHGSSMSPQTHPGKTASSRTATTPRTTMSTVVEHLASSPVSSSENIFTKVFSSMLPLTSESGTGAMDDKQTLTAFTTPLGENATSSRSGAESTTISKRFSAKLTPITLTPTLLSHESDTTVNSMTTTSSPAMIPGRSSLTQNSTSDTSTPPPQPSTYVSAQSQTNDKIMESSTTGTGKNRSLKTLPATTAGTILNSSRQFFSTATTTASLTTQKLSEHTLATVRSSSSKEMRTAGTPVQFTGTMSISPLAGKNSSSPTSFQSVTFHQVFEQPTSSEITPSKTTTSPNTSSHVSSLKPEVSTRKVSTSSKVSKVSSPFSLTSFVSSVTPTISETNSAPSLMEFNESQATVLPQTKADDSHTELPRADAGVRFETTRKTDQWTVQELTTVLGSSGHVGEKREKPDTAGGDKAFVISTAVLGSLLLLTLTLTLVLLCRRHRQKETMRRSPPALDEETVMTYEMTGAMNSRHETEMVEKSTTYLDGIPRGLNNHGYLHSLWRTPSPTLTRAVPTIVVSDHIDDDNSDEDEHRTGGYDTLASTGNQGAMTTKDSVTRFPSSPHSESPRERSAFTAVVSISASSVSSKTTTTLSPTTSLTGSSRPQHEENRRLSGSSSSRRSSAGSEGPPPPSPQGSRDRGSQKLSSDEDHVYAEVVKVGAGTRTPRVHQSGASSASRQSQPGASPTFDTELKDVPRKPLQERKIGHLNAAKPAAPDHQSADNSHNENFKPAIPGQLKFAGERFRSTNAAQPHGNTESRAGYPRNKPLLEQRGASSVILGMNVNPFSSAGSAVPQRVQQTVSEAVNGKSLTWQKPAVPEGTLQPASSRASPSTTPRGQRQESTAPAASSSTLRQPSPRVHGEYSAHNTGNHIQNNTALGSHRLEGNRRDAEDPRNGFTPQRPTPPAHQHRTETNRTKQQTNQPTLKDKSTDFSRTDSKEGIRRFKTLNDLTKDDRNPGESRKDATSDDEKTFNETSLEESQESKAAADTPVSRRHARGGRAGGIYKQNALNRGGRVEKAPPDYIRKRATDSIPTADSTKTASPRTAVTANGVSRTASDSPEESDSILSRRMMSALSSQTGSDIMVRETADKSTNDEEQAKLFSNLGNLQVSDL